MKKVFIDTEFTGLYQNSTLISLALVAESGEEFYAEFTDYDETLVTEWCRQNVLNRLVLTPGVEINGLSSYKICADKSAIARAVKNWLMELSNIRNSIQIWGDCPAWDWVLFNNLFGYNNEGVPLLPASVHYMPMDIAVLAQIKGMNPDFSRFDYVRDSFDIEELARKHNALADARVIRLCYNKIIS